MSKLLGAIAVISMNVVLVGTVTASEFSNKCSCVTSPTFSSNAIGKINSVNGDVLYTAAKGYQKGESGSTFVSNAQISVGEDSSARISVGATCKLNIPSNSIVTFQQSLDSTGSICVKVSSLFDTSTGLVQSGSSTQTGATVPWVIVGGAVAFGAVIIVTGGSKPASP